MKRTLVIGLIFTFVLSTVGMPITLHYCEMQNRSSFSNCEMCMSKKTQKKMSCCEDEKDYPVQLKSDNFSRCCETKIIDKSISDNFISVKVELKKEQLLSITSLFNMLSKYFEPNQTIVKHNLSPPLFYHNDLYLQNSILLI